VTSAVTLANPASTLTTDGTTYTDFLPSINLKGDLGDGNVVRFGLSQQIARPDLTDLRNSFAVGKDNNIDAFVGSAGNPHLKPFKAIALDLAYEKYFGTKAYFGAAAFYKKLDTYITQTTNLAFDYTAYAALYNLTPTATHGLTGIYTAPSNGSGGSISGVELTASAPFNLVASALDGFGMTASYSYTDSTVKLPNLIGLNPSQQVAVNGATMQLPGLSKSNTKLMLYFERWGFSAFVAHNARSAYIGKVANSTVGGYPALVNIDAQTWVSAQIGYEFQEGLFKGLGLRFEGNNMNKPVYTEHNGGTTNENRTGATYAFKLSYKLQ
jgi:iron complex outermembrane recepter protein